MAPYISLVLPIYNEQGNINELYDRSQKVLQQLGRYEIIFVNDGSKDESFPKLQKIALQDHHVRVINFSRNFGHQIAITAGIDYASGDAVVIMDSDLQDTPEIIPAMLSKWKDGYDVVYAKRRKRKDSLFKKFTAFLFYRLLKKLASIDIPEDTGDFRLMDRKVIDEMKRLKEHSRFMRGLTSWVGFKQTFVLFDRAERKHGMTGYPLRKMIKFALDGLTSFSYVPLKMATFLGFLSAFVGFVWGVYAIIRKMYYPTETVTGWTTLVVAIFFIGGVQLIVLGVIGEYIGRIYTEAQNRPLYVIRDKINF